MKRLSSFRFYSYIFALILVIFSNSLYASSNTLTTVTHEVQGQGETPNLAVSNAIINGVSQVNGTYVSSVSAAIDEQAIAKGYVTIGNQRYPVNENLFSKENISAVGAATNGSVISYQIIDKVKRDDLWFVRLRMTFAQYRSISQDKKERYSFAVLPFQVNSGALDGPISQKRSINLLSQAITNDISQSDKFRLIDRNDSDLNNYAKEVSILASGNVNSLDKGRLSQLVGADYLLVGTIDQLKIKDQSKTYYGTDFSHYIASTTINYRLVEMATMEILHADTVTVSIPEDQINQVLQDPDNNLQTIEQMLITKAANKISQEVLANTK